MIVLALTLVLALCACNHEHQYTTKVDVEATCTEAGTSHDECSLCGARTEDEEIPALGHEFEKDADENAVWSFDSEEHWHQCLRCGEKIDAAGAIGGTAHTLNEDFECSVCSYAKFEYKKSGEGYVLTKYNGGEENVVIPATYKGAAVLGIGEGVFSLNAKISSVTIPASVKSIGRDAFSGASALNTVKAASLGAWLGITFDNYTSNPMHVASEIYFGNTKLGGSLEIPADTQTVNEYAFYGFGTIETVNIPDSVKSIGYRAFEGAFKKDAGITVNITDLAKWCAIEFSKGKTDMDKCSANPLSLGATLKLNNAAVAEALDLTGISKVGAYAFFGYDKITSVNCPATEIGKYAFANCEKLKSVTLAAAELPEGLFKGCASLDSVTLTGTASIGTSAFENCEKLASIALPATVTAIGDKAFAGCAALATIDGAEGLTALTRVGESAFYGTKLFELVEGETFGQVYVGKVFVGIKGEIPTTGDDAGKIEIQDGTVAIADGALSNVANLKSIKLPDTLTYIGKNAMRYTGLVESQLESVELGGAQEIGESAFAGNANLESIQLPYSLQRIGESAFAGCTALTDVVLPASVTTIGKGAFAQCSALRSVYYMGTTEEQFKTIAIADGNIGGTLTKVYYFSAVKPDASASDFWYFNEKNEPTIW